MKSIWTVGEALCEIMRIDTDAGLDTPELFKGPYPSGAPAIFIDTAAKLGTPSGLIGTVGNDAFGACIRRRLLADGADCSLLATNAMLSTAVAFVAYTSDGDRTFIFHIGNAAAGDIHYPEHMPENVGIFHVMGCAMMPSPAMADCVMRAAEHYYEQGALISFDPNIRIESLHDQDLQELVRPIMERCSILLPGVEELHVIGDEKNGFAAFAGVEAGKLEMLFVAPEKRGRGLGRELVEYLVARRGVRRVDVNEQNAQAAGFYARMGFRVVSRSETDPSGRPYPILHLSL